jgi:NAD(P)H-dependent FMN reductase
MAADAEAESRTEQRPTLQVIIGSTRPGRLGEPIGNWVYERAAAHGAFEAELVDLAEVGLPLLDEPNHPSTGQYVHQHTKDWSATVLRADAFVFVFPEYNHGINAALKNAIDFLHREWRYKPAGIVSYGGVSAGLRAAQALRPVLSGLKMVPMQESVSIPFAKTLVHDGALAPNDSMERSAVSMLDELIRWSGALAGLRTLEQP